MSGSETGVIFDPACRSCSRLSQFLDRVSVDHPSYFAQPVPPFGDPQADFLIVGLAPGMHGANRTGRPFTGDHAGILLYQTLFDFGFSSAPESISADDGLELHNCRISNAVKCLPPQNKPLTEEIRNCIPFLREELAGLSEGAVVLALGKIAHDAVLRAFSLPLSHYRFAHAAEHRIEQLTVLDSYHCSRYNTQTRRLTETMFRAVMERAREMLK
ncbi:Uracil-DNA glycosylase, family 5 [hydrothermal vent metagenome]|uniref:Type-5 uracil-DNA glycosylase n=1 Tax=hydrothermal vent metagenome TaxID=652676 RepID=A0A3B0YIW1_9ZZZZ